MIFALALCLASSSLWANGCEPAKPAAHDDPFVMLNDVPVSVDAALVFNNPAHHILLNDSGRTARKLLAMAGIFTHTEHAWDALANAFNAETDDTINSLLGQRVVVMWGDIGSSSNSVMKFADAIDTQWVLMCEVDPGYLKEIQARLKPVRRDIQHGYTVYAIEQGRYEIVLLSSDAHAKNKVSRVILAPKQARPLLVEVLAKQASTGVIKQSSILTQSKPLIESIQRDRSDWQAAWVVQLNPFIPGPPDRPASILAGVINLSDEGIETSFATDMQIDLPTADAPVGLLSAVGDEAILAIAMSQTPSLIIEDNVVRYMYELQAASPTLSTDAKSSQAYLGGPGLVLLSEVESISNKESAEPLIALTVMTGLTSESADSGTLAMHVDQIIHGLFEAINPEDAPMHNGRFPNAVRTHTLESQTPANQAHPDAWPGDHAKFSWIASDLEFAPAVITTLAPQNADAAQQARWVAQAAKNLDSIPDQHQCKGVITSGYFWPSRASKLLESASPVDLAISKLVKRIEWEISHAPFGISGSAKIEFAGMSNFAQLGKNKDK